MDKSSLQLEHLADEPKCFLIGSYEASDSNKYFEVPTLYYSSRVSNHNSDELYFFFLWLNIYFQALADLINWFLSFFFFFNQYIENSCWTCWYWHHEEAEHLPTERG